MMKEITSFVTLKICAQSKKKTHQVNFPDIQLLVSSTENRKSPSRVVSAGVILLFCLILHVTLRRVAQTLCKKSKNGFITFD